MIVTTIGIDNDGLHTAAGTERLSRRPSVKAPASGMKPVGTSARNANASSSIT